MVNKFPTIIIQFQQTASFHVLNMKKSPPNNEHFSSPNSEIDILTGVCVHVHCFYPEQRKNTKQGMLFDCLHDLFVSN